jgi:hypothetical protein
MRKLSIRIRVAKENKRRLTNHLILALSNQQCLLNPAQQLKWRAKIILAQRSRMMAIVDFHGENLRLSHRILDPLRMIFCLLKARVVSPPAMLSPVMVPNLMTAGLVDSMRTSTVMPIDKTRGGGVEYRQGCQGRLIKARALEHTADFKLFKTGSARLVFNVKT